MQSTQWSSKFVSPLAAQRCSRWIAAVGVLSALSCNVGPVFSADTAAIVPVDTFQKSNAIGTSSTVASSPLPGYSVPAPSASSVVAPPLPQGASLINIDAVDMLVSDVVAMISQQSDLNILVNEDINNRIKSIKLTDVTVDQAIQYVAQTAGLSLTKVDHKTYILAKGLPSSVAAIQPSTNSFRDTVKLLPGVGIIPDDVPIPELKPTNRDSDEPITFRALQLRNVKPSFMAYWLDPENHPRPLELQQSDDRAEGRGQAVLKPREAIKDTNKNGIPDTVELNGFGQNQGNQFNNPYAPYNPYLQASPQFGGRGGGGGGARGGGGGGARGGGGGGGRGGGLGSAAGSILLPTGVESLTAIDPQNALLVRGTDEGIDQIRTVISYLDRPIAQVEIEAQFITLNRSDTKSFGFSIEGTNGNIDGTGATSPAVANGAGISVDIVRGNFQAQLRAFQNSNQGRVTSSPRVTTFNNLTARLTETLTTPVVFTSSTVTPGTGGSPPIITTTQDEREYTAGTILTVTPTINQDGTITIAMQPLVVENVGFVTVPGTGTSPTISIPITQAQQIDTVSNIRDGDTLAIGGLRSKSISRGRSGIPLLSSLPIIGGLFRGKDDRIAERELIIFVTARIVRRTLDPVAGT